MHPVSAIVVFIMVWWSVLFCVLPFGLPTTYEDREDGDNYSAPGAPKTLNMKRKLLITSAISLVLWAGICLFINSGIIDFRTWALQE